MKKPRAGRSLRLANSGRWYVAMAIGFGVVAISSGNNVLYLLESLLLGGLVLSGVLSERAVSVIDVSWKRKPATAGVPAQDVITLENKSRFPLFCIEVGEWASGEIRTRVFVPFVPGKSSVQVSVTVPYARRGKFEWEGVSVATQYPFGFAKKIRYVLEPGRRLIWPSRADGTRRDAADPEGNGNSDQQRLATRAQVTAQAAKIGSSEFSDGEIRPLQQGDDYRDVVWTLSAKRGEPLVRLRQGNRTVREVALDLRQDPGLKFESQISFVSEVFYREGEGVLLILDWGGVRRVEGAKAALDSLAMIQATGKMNPNEGAA